MERESACGCLDGQVGVHVTYLLLSSIGSESVVLECVQLL